MPDQRHCVLDRPFTQRKVAGHPPSSLHNLPLESPSSTPPQATIPDFAALAPVAALITQGDYTQAELVARSLTRQLPQNPLVWKILATLLTQRKQLPEAVNCYRRLIEIQPELAVHHTALGALLSQQNDVIEAESCYRRALALDASSTDAYSLLTSLLINQQRFAEAEAACRRSLECNPPSPATEKKLGYILHQTGRNAEAAQAYRRALAIDPEDHQTHSLLLMCLSHDAACGAEGLFIEHLDYGERVEAPYRSHWPQHRNSIDPERRLNIGFVSADFRDHAVSYFLEPILARFAANPNLAAAFALHAFSQTVSEDATTQKLRSYFQHWTPIENLSDETLTGKVKNDSIDILIDLSGHTPGNRLAAFARKPAPVQLSWIGYPGTTGLQAMDYFLADRFLLPRDQFAPQFTENIVYLPAAFPFQPSTAPLSVNPLPAFQNGHFTFASFNRPAKLSQPVIALWAKLLSALPNAHMLLAAVPNDDSCSNLLAWFEQSEIDRHRLHFHPRSDMQTYLELHHQVDLCLDTFPYSGATTTYHALWMGVPTLTLAGNTPAGRDSMTVLSHLGLESFITHSHDEFVKRGLHWAANLNHLAQVRSRLREGLAHSPSGDPAIVADALAVALRTMWRRWCAQQPPEAF